MPITISRLYSNNNILSASHLDAICDPVTTLFNTTLLDNSYFQPGGLIGANFANSTITSAQLGAGCVHSGQIASSAVTTAKIGPLAVSIPQLAAFNSSASDSCASFTTASTTLVQVTNLSVTMNFSGLRPVFMSVIPTGNTLGLEYRSVAGFFAWVKNGTPIASFLTVTSNTSTNDAFSFSSVDPSPTVGSNTYSFQMASSANSGVSNYIANARIYVWEPG